MKYYKIIGYVMPKGQEDKGWQKIKDGFVAELPDDVNPYNVINDNFNFAASHWMFTVDEISGEEARKE